MNYSLNVKSSSIVHTLLSNCVKLLGKVQKLLIECIIYSVISKRIRVVSPKFYTARKNFTGPPVPTVPTNFKSVFNTSFNYWVLGLPPSSITTLTVMLAALNFVLGASIRRLWALRTQRKSIERDVCAPVVLAHQHVVALIWVQRDPERINHNHKSRSLVSEWAF